MWNLPVCLEHLVFSKITPSANLDPWETGRMFLKRKKWPPSTSLDRDVHPQLLLNVWMGKIDAVVANGLCSTCSVDVPSMPHFIFTTPLEVLILQTRKLRLGGWVIGAGSLALSGQVWDSSAAQSDLQIQLSNHDTRWLPQIKMWSFSIPSLRVKGKRKKKGWFWLELWNFYLKFWKEKKKAFVLRIEIQSYFF